MSLIALQFHDRCGANEICTAVCSGSENNVCQTLNVKGEAAASLAVTATVDGGWRTRETHNDGCQNNNQHSNTNCYQYHGRDVLRSAKVYCPTAPPSGDAASCAVTCTGELSKYRHPTSNFAFDYLHEDTNSNTRCYNSGSCGEPHFLCKSMKIYSQDTGEHSGVSLSCTGDGRYTCMDVVLESAATLPCSLDCVSTGKEVCKSLVFNCAARQDSAEDVCRLKAPCCAAMTWIFIPAYSCAIP